ncbi:DNA topoisomerase IB [Arthrobacter agilis]|uniref:DNA topoisomerase IB n=1 Tax=Arthrobacter agilis TaxID=37921 RepID=UPI000B34F96A|nr:DNA topoisomerase IB [Arthrobacter agilis]OUM42371.1 DNA topoisomerase [Arthrobacter agilis]PPB45713.1 DNA topoisomerase [Arthrobacter agilis]TPV26306.1 DNA topoisomerase IB [Arthrobacter agilis]VDR30838.1 Eukaryotic DNA topoisomerase I, catalytic core [Arthrobacter agilis]
MARLRRSNTRRPGISRRRHGKGFSYRAPSGELLQDREEIERIKDLVIPPAWKDVWIAPYPNGHVQAIGTDDAGRRQYMYHPAWREQKDREKFDRALDFGAKLPSARRAITQHLRSDGVQRERAFAAALRIVDSGALRIGSAQYAEANGSFGVTTLLVEHCTIDGNVIVFDFPGKSGQHWDTRLEDEDLAAALRPMVGREAADTVLAYQSDNGAWHHVDGAQLNEFLRQVTGGPFTAKDFRTWQATVVAAMALAKEDVGATTRTARQKAVTATMKAVADHLGNTPTVARSSYVDPRLVDRFMSGEVIPIATYSASEKAVQELLRD